MPRAPFLAPLVVSSLAVLASGQAGEAPAERAAAPAPAASPGPEEEPIETFVEVRNPAFPTPEVAPPTVHRGRRFSPTELAPYFAEGALAEARAELSRGRFDRARALLDQELASGQAAHALPARYLRAMAALRGGDHAFAGQEMKALSDEYLPMRDRALTHGGIAHEEQGKWDEAAALFSAVPAGSRLYVDARLGLSRVLRKKKDLSGAIAALEPLAAKPMPSWGRNVGAEALVAMADLAREQKDAKAEREALVKLWARHPLSPLSVKAEARLGGTKKLPTEALVTRAEVLIDAHRNKQGIEALAGVLPGLKLPDELACRASFAHGKALRKERQHTAAIAALGPVVAKCKDLDLRARAMYVLGSSQSIVDLAHAPATYEALAREFPEHSFADDALYFATDVYAKLGDDESALARVDELLERYPHGDFLAEALFRASWIHRTAKRYDRQLEYVALIEKHFSAADDTLELERARYWRARTWEDQGKTQEAAELLETLAVEHPATYYGLMSRARLASLDKERAEKLAPRLLFERGEVNGWPLFAGPLSDDPHLLAAVELIRLGFPEAAPSELLAINRIGLPAESVRLIVQLLALAGDTRAAHGVARMSLRRDLSGRITPENRSIWEIAYPTAYRELIEKHCKKVGLEPDLMQALMREESALDPKVRSWAGALGLAQLMPRTAAAIAAQLKLKRPTEAALLEPELNIRLGATYLGNLQKRFAGTKQLMLASYNAGENAVEKWRKRRPDEELDVWVENIPIAETRKYVKSVLRSYNTYQLLYAGRSDGGAATGRK